MHQFLLFSQAQQQPTGAEIAAVIVVLVISLIISFAVAIVICTLLYMTQSRLPHEHRKISAGSVWLLLIPLFSLIWNFFVFQRIPESYKSYFDEQGRTDVGDCGKTIGLWYSICAVVTIVPCVNYISGPAALVLLIIFLVKVMGLRSQIPVANSQV